DPPLCRSGTLDVFRILLVPCAVDDPRDLLLAAKQDAVTRPMSVLARVQLREVARRISTLADVNGHREHRFGHGERRGSVARGLAGEDEAGEVGARLGGDRDVLLARQAADFDEWPRE